ncbi:hypothetical protein HDV00_008027 [Rhizophlyctis rosea]|nr:hypothetical protein HDV00_008027 [Rhizophlyctis rosea]
MMTWFRPFKRSRKSSSACKDAMGKSVETKGVGVRVVVVGGNERQKEVYRKPADAETGWAAPMSVVKNAMEGIEQDVRVGTVARHAVGRIEESAHVAAGEAHVWQKDDGMDLHTPSPSPPPPSASTTPTRRSNANSVTGDSGVDVNSKKSTAPSSASTAGKSIAGSDSGSPVGSRASSGVGETDVTSMVPSVTMPTVREFRNILPTGEHRCESPIESPSPPNEPAPLRRPSKPLPQPPMKKEASSSKVKSGGTFPKPPAKSNHRKSSVPFPAVPVVDVFEEAFAARLELFDATPVNIPHISPPKTATANSSSPPSTARPKSHSEPVPADESKPKRSLSHRYSFIDIASANTPSAVPAKNSRWSLSLGRRRNSIIQAVEDGHKEGLKGNEDVMKILENIGRPSSATEGQAEPTIRSRQPHPSVDSARPTRNYNPRPSSSSRTTTGPRRFSASGTQIRPTTSWYLPTSAPLNDYSPAVARRAVCAGMPIVLPGVYYGPKIGTNNGDQTAAQAEKAQQKHDITPPRTHFQQKSQTPIDPDAITPIAKTDKPIREIFPRHQQPQQQQQQKQKQPPTSPSTTSYTYYPANPDEAGPSQPRVVVTNLDDTDIVAPATNGDSHFGASASYGIPHARNARAYAVPNPKWQGKGKGKGKEIVLKPTLVVA